MSRPFARVVKTTGHTEEVIAIVISALEIIPKIFVK